MMTSRGMCADFACHCVCDNVQLTLGKDTIIKNMRMEISNIYLMIAAKELPNKHYGWVLGTLLHEAPDFLFGLANGKWEMGKHGRSLQPRLLSSPSLIDSYPFFVSCLQVQDRYGIIYL